jgi:hypothetical protein
MDDFLPRMFGDLTGRVGGPLTFRLILQPMVAAAYAIHAGLADARTGRPAYFWTLLTDPVHRRDRLREGWKAVGNVFILAVVIDVLYQVIVFQWVYPGEALVVAFLLAAVPYLLLRGPIARLARSARRV